MILNNADKIYVGATEADKICLGSTVIWSGETSGSTYAVISGLTKSSSDFTVKLDDTDTTAKITGTDGDYYTYAVYGSYDDSHTMASFASGNTDIVSCHIITNGITVIGNYAFQYCTSLTSITIPSSVTSIGSYAFNSCSSLTSITIPNSVTSIGYQTFYNCASLTSITIPNSVTDIGSYTFYGCSSLTNITISDGVTSIRNATFQYCTSLTSITIPSSVTSIGSNAFNYCKQTVFHMEATTPPTLSSTNAFRNTYGIIYVPVGYGDTYKAATNWSSYSSRIYEEGS